MCKNKLACFVGAIQRVELFHVWLKQLLLVGRGTARWRLILGVRKFDKGIYSFVCHLDQSQKNGINIC
jgi:hypothetical protein